MRRKTEERISQVDALGRFLQINPCGGYAHVQVEGELRYREYEKEYGTKKAPARVKHRVAEIHISRILKLDRAEKQDEPAPEVDPSELPADQPTP
jgi:hypothetical protein